jgi:hypothetical protein
VKICEGEKNDYLVVEIYGPSSRGKRCGLMNEKRCGLMNEQRTEKEIEIIN